MRMRGRASVWVSPTRAWIPGLLELLLTPASHACLLGVGALGWTSHPVLSTQVPKPVRAFAAAAQRIQFQLLSLRKQAHVPIHIPATRRAPVLAVTIEKTCSCVLTRCSLDTQGRQVRVIDCMTSGKRLRGVTLRVSQVFGSARGFERLQGRHSGGGTLGTRGRPIWEPNSREVLTTELPRV